MSTELPVETHLILISHMTENLERDANPENTQLTRYCRHGILFYFDYTDDLLN